MSDIMTIHMKSGKTYDVYLDPNELTPDESAEEFYKNDFTHVSSIRLNNGIYFFREIEAITFK